MLLKETSDRESFININYGNNIYLDKRYANA